MFLLLLKNYFPIVYSPSDTALFCDIMFEDIESEAIDDLTLDGSLERPSTEGRISTCLTKQFIDIVIEWKMDIFLSLDEMGKLTELDTDDGIEHMMGDWREHDYIIQSIEKLGTEKLLEILHELWLEIRWEGREFTWT